MDEPQINYSESREDEGAEIELSQLRNANGLNVMGIVNSKRNVEEGDNMSETSIDDLVAAYHLENEVVEAAVHEEEEAPVQEEEAAAPIEQAEVALADPVEQQEALTAPVRNVEIEEVDDQRVSHPILQNSDAEDGQQRLQQDPQFSASSANSRRERILRHIEVELLNAAKVGDPKVIKEYKSQGDQGRSKLKGQTVLGNTILHVYLGVVDKENVNGDFIDQVLVAAPELQDIANDAGEVPLHLAAKYGQLKAVECILKDENENSTSLLLRSTNDKDTALHLAVRNKHDEVVDHLLSKSLPVELQNYSTNTAGKTPLYLAAETGSSKLFSKIFEKTSTPQLSTGSSGSLLHAAVIWGQAEMVEKIMSKAQYRVLIRTKDKDRLTPLHYAAGGKNEILKVLLDSDSSAAYIQDKQGRTAAHIAAQCNNVAGLELLAYFCPDCCDIADDQGRNVVHYAADLGFAKALDYFLKNSRFIQLFNMQDNNFETPLHLLANTITQLPLPVLTPIELLIPKLKKLQLNVFNKQKLTPGNIAHSHDIYEMEPTCQEFMKKFRAEVPQGGYVNHLIKPLEEYKVTVLETKQQGPVSNLQKTMKNHSIVATLIATLAFAAGINVPGGFNQDYKDVKKGGTAVLIGKPAFRVFLIADSISLTSSVIAILIYFFLSFGKGKGFTKDLFILAFIITSISMFALTVAFMAGTYIIVQPSQIFSFLMLLIPCAFIFCYTIFVCTFSKLIGSVRILKNKKKLRSLRIAGDGIV